MVMSAWHGKYPSLASPFEILSGYVHTHVYLRMNLTLFCQIRENLYVRFSSVIIIKCTLNLEENSLQASNVPFQ